MGAAPTKPLEDVKFEAYDLTGKAVSKAEVLKRLKAGGMVLIAGDNRLPADEFLKPFKSDLLVLVSSELVGVPTGGQTPLLPAVPGRLLPAPPLCRRRAR